MFISSHSISLWFSALQPEVHTWRLVHVTNTERNCLWNRFSSQCHVSRHWSLTNSSSWTSSYKKTMWHSILYGIIPTWPTGDTGTCCDVSQHDFEDYRSSVSRNFIENRDHPHHAAKIVKKHFCRVPWLYFHFWFSLWKSTHMTW